METLSAVSPKRLWRRLFHSRSYGWRNLGYNIKMELSTIGCGLGYGSATYLYKDDNES